MFRGTEIMYKCLLHTYVIECFYVGAAYFHGSSYGTVLHTFTNLSKYVRRIRLTGCIWMHVIIQKAENTDNELYQRKSKRIGEYHMKWRKGCRSGEKTILAPFVSHERVRCLFCFFIMFDMLVKSFYCIPFVPVAGWNEKKNLSHSFYTFSLIANDDNRTHTRTPTPHA